MKITEFLKVVLVFYIFFSCSQKSRQQAEISNIPVDLRIERFDQLFAEATPTNLTDLKKDYPFLFPEKFPDSVWLKRMQDTLQMEINREVNKKFPSLDKEEEKLTSLLQHIKYYFPEVTVPRVITITSDVDYQNKVILAKDLLIISLDTYLGKDHYFYEAIQQYIKGNFTKEQILPDVATMYAKQLVELPKNRTFLANLIYYGKELYLKDLFLPNISNATKLGYTQEEFDWVQANEEEIWRYFIDRQLLYSTDKNLSTRFLYPAPFSKFYLEEIDRESPDRVGQYIGWQIVNSYMKNNNVSLRQLLIEDAETIFNKSKYKPTR